MAQKNRETMRIILIIIAFIVYNISNAQIVNFNCEVIGQTDYAGLSLGSCTVNTSTWTQGAYLYSLKTGEKSVANHKFVLVK